MSRLRGLLRTGRPSGFANKDKPIRTIVPVLIELLLAQERAGMTDAELSRRSGYSVTVLSNIRAGRMPALRTVIDMAEVFGLEVHLTPRTLEQGGPL